MKACGIFAASLFGALVAAVPLHRHQHKRDIVWVTEVAYDVVTVDVVATVWVGADGAEATPATNYGHHSWTGPPAHATSSSVDVPVASSSAYVAPTSSSASSVEVEPTSSAYVEPTPSSSSVYVAPTPSSSSVYVAPTTSSVEVVPTTSSVEVIPTTSATSVYVAPTTSETPATTEAPSSTYVAPSSTSSAAAATSSSSSSGSSGGLAASGTTYTGDLTWYDTGMGACGLESTSEDHIVAISQSIFDDPEYATANPNLNPLCGRYVSIKGKDGTDYQAKVVDRCVGCLENALDLSSTLFNLATSNGDGRVSGMTWSWV